MDGQRGMSIAVGYQMENSLAMQYILVQLQMKVKFQSKQSSIVLLAKDYSILESLNRHFLLTACEQPMHKLLYVRAQSS